MIVPRFLIGKGQKINGINFIFFRQYVNVFDKDLNFCFAEPKKIT